MKSRLLVAGNWKMNLSRQEAQILASEVAGMLTDEIAGDFPVVLFPPFPYLATIAAQIQDNKRLKIGAQTCSTEISGAFTGEVSAMMLASCGVSYVLAGHSERRANFGETDQVVAMKVKRILEAGLIPVFCCGETLDERINGFHFETIQRQIDSVLEGMREADFRKLVIAYEPVWAIGTGQTATSAQAAEMHNYIRTLLKARFAAAAENCCLLYGGSCNENNAGELALAANVDGGLIGGASLKSRPFISIVKAFS